MSYRDENPWHFGRLGLLVASAIAYGVVGYMVIEGWGFVDALYMTVLALTAVGFTEVHPLDQGGRIFTISLIVAGVSVVVIALSIFARAIEEGGLGQRGRRRRMAKRIAQMKGHAIVCGFGRVGRTVVEELERDGVPYVVIDKDEGREHELLDGVSTYFIGDATKREDLEAAGIHRARALISAVDDDAENIFITMVARSVSATVWIVARAEQEESIDRLQTAGASRVFSPFVTAGREMAYAAIKQRVVDFIEVEAEHAAPLRLEELRIDSGSDLVGKVLGSVRGRATALAIRHADGRVEAPPSDEVTLQEGDALVLLGERDELRPLEQA
ncbi:MAG: NAD-binding protein [Actinobacteria bacterium]|nr:NAD-binding protein [Actinomycetota bacterium]